MSFLFALLFSVHASAAFKVGLVLDKGGKDDKSFNTSAYNGATKAEKELGSQFDIRGFHAEVLKDGWFHTGDIGEFRDGFLAITDRKKEIFKTSGGKCVAPQVIENVLKESLYIEQCMVVGENKNFPSALIVADLVGMECPRFTALILLIDFFRT